MPVLVDGNNLLFAARALDENGPAIGRSMLCSALAQWSRRTRQAVQVVFDGPAPSADVAFQIAGDEIAVSFSGAQTADEVMERMLETDSAARRLCVVSSDRRVRKAAKRRGARSLSSEEFWTGLRSELSRPRPASVEPREKRAGLGPDDADTWLKRFGLDP